ncbi:MAG: radical SAM protein [Clostridia bacterium]|nr:radical SAM protein [Clostridia bacterium]
MINLYKNCTLCPRECNIDRNSGTGYCGEGSTLNLTRAALHMWEEPCISGSNGSGTIFFRGCSLKCIYCQNFSIAHNKGGKDISITDFSDICLNLQKTGAHNINLVTPTHFVPHIVEGICLAKEKGLSIPVVYNTSGFEKAETVKLLNGIVDIFLTDFKYIKSETAKKYSNAEKYVDYAKASLSEMVKIAPYPVIKNGIMQKGVIVRVLLLPDHLIETKMIIKYLYDTYGDNIYISLMNQYTPIKEHPYKNLNRTVTDYEYKSLIDYAAHLGIKNAFIQKGETAKESFIPSFDLTGIEQRAHPADD